MTPEIWVEKFKAIFEKSEWEALEKLRTTTNEHFAATFDAAGVSAFYSEVIKLALDAAHQSKLAAANSAGIAEKVQAALKESKDKIHAANGDIKGLYLEYYFDGCPDASALYLFLCTEYDDECPSWAAEFEQDGVIDGGSLPEYFYVEPDDEADYFSELVIKEYANGQFLAICLEALKSADITGIPFGYANHDNDMIRMPAL
uniref:hypothetical protein n=1 Tax=Thaumasiovibrio occultus TaxID=1891184 RepID=UPI000B35C6A4|nr:hypothetical protein [Thaumasiovibrio occultus]